MLNSQSITFGAPFWIIPLRPFVVERPRPKARVAAIAASRLSAISGRIPFRAARLLLGSVLAQALPLLPAIPAPGVINPGHWDEAFGLDRHAFGWGGQNAAPVASMASKPLV